MSRKEKRNKGKSAAQSVITAALAVILIVCTGLALWTSVDPDWQRAGPLVFLTASASNADDGNSARAKPTNNVKTPLETKPPVNTPKPTHIPVLTPAPTADNSSAPTPTPSPAPISETPIEIKISAVGDITMACEVMGNQRRFEKKAEEKGLDYFFSGVVDILSGDDLTVGNLEGPLTSARSHRKGRDYIFKGKAEYAEALTLGSIEAVTIANNHAHDFFGAGQKDTQKALDAAGVTWFGFGKTAVYEVNGARIGLIGLTEWDFTQGQMTKAVKTLKEKCDIVIAEIHWGVEKRFKPTKKQKKLGHALIDAGADAVFGHHSHVVGGIELYNGKTIVYSLGNFCFAGNTNPSDKDTFIFTQSFLVDKQKGVVTYADHNIIPCSVSSSENTNDFRPAPVTGKRAQAVMAKIKKASERFDKTLDFNALEGSTSREGE